jgi:hypothetical protein
MSELSTDIIDLDDTVAGNILPLSQTNIEIETANKKKIKEET